MRGLPWVLAAFVLLAGAAVPLPAGAAGTSFINVVSAGDHGCSPDSFTSPDLRVTVLVDGQQALRTAKAQDQDDPLYAQLATVAAPTPSSPVQVTIQVEEAEPSGFFFTGTNWLHCDTDPGPGTDYTLSWDGRPLTIVTKGDASNAAEATVVLGPGAPPVPQVTASDLQPTSATLSWDASSAGHRVAWGNAGRVIATLPPGTASYTVTGLCDNTPYAVRVVRDVDPWHVGSADAPFTTANAAPQPPKVLSAKVDNGSLALRVGLPTSHDLAKLEVFGGPDASVPASGSPIVTDSHGPWFGSWYGSAPGSAAYVRVRVTDTGGLSATSDAFQVGSPGQSGGPADFCPRATTASTSDGSGSAAGSSSTSGTPSSSSSTSGSAASSSSPSSSPTSSGPEILTTSPSPSASRSFTQLAPLPNQFDLPGTGAPSQPHAEAATATGSGSSLTIPLNPVTIGIAVVAAVAVGAAIGLALRRR
jgi:hypothetical protein